MEKQTAFGPSSQQLEEQYHSSQEKGQAIHHNKNQKNGQKPRLSRIKSRQCSWTQEDSETIH